MAPQELAVTGELDILSPEGYWMRVSAPTAKIPSWHNAEDGATMHYTTIVIGREGEELAQIQQMHAQAIASLLEAAFVAASEGDDKERRRLTFSAARLCEQTIGLWPTR